MTRDRGYPDWLVLSARLLWAGYHSAKIYMFWSCLACGYVKILQPVAICTVIFVTLGRTGPVVLTTPHAGTHAHMHISSVGRFFRVIHHNLVALTHEK